MGHIPMISDCAVLAPERYIFRAGIVTSSNGMFLVCVLLYSLMRLLGKDPTKSQQVMLALSFFASLALTGVGVINEKEDNPVHTTCAVIFFVLSQVYMTIAVQQLYVYYRNGEKRVTKTSIILKGILMTLGALDLAGFLYGTIRGSETIQALCEWTGVLLIQFFMFTCNLDFKHDLYYATLIDKNANPADYSANGSNLSLRRNLALRAQPVSLELQSSDAKPASRA